MSKFDRARFVIFGLVFVSRDSELGRNVSCEESTVIVILLKLFDFVLLTDCHSHANIRPNRL